jgi:aminopeptidase N
MSRALLPLFAHEREHIVALEQVFGRYPFDVYGTMGVDLPIDFAVENQGLTTLTAALRFAGPEFWATTMVHETAHQWMGDSVSVWTYADIWLSEGHATFYELLFADAEGLMPQAREAASLEDYMHQLYGVADEWRAEFGPVSRPLNGDWTQPLNRNIYEGGALVLYALRTRIGAAAFARLERQFAQRFAGRSIRTSDFIALASRVSGRDQGPFLRDWLYGTRTPPMPGHPDW